ncbi:zinc finger protein CONSTANS-LIKE 9-like isoform X2 [Juglans microcarpa x Juglans regia]|uniref:zinc finger protein CONSTANS-LIKE 9-like isoform X2 n=1 Tax=Juglans microcarpa x Juglans regia TaxID=2249226 RepID=UPI001B7F7849|nr:zinc finger protein CONSTANS-LIKE 9-like isoform X2 [Juglans microcarpa x Juglans regia]
MKNCELCKAPARTYCESDEASLCWDCDAKVHGANFLVARHSRTLLCHACQTQTPWRASGAKLGHTVSVCVGCVAGNRNKDDERESQGGNDDDLEENDRDQDVDDIDDAEEDDDDEDGDADNYAEKEGDNQVVPWSMPPAASSSSSEEVSVTTFALKRMRENDLDLGNAQDDLSRSSTERENGAALTAQADDGEATSVDSVRPRKNRRTESDRAVEVDGGEASSSTIIGSLRRIRRRD